MAQSNLRRTKLPNEGNSKHLLSELSSEHLSVHGFEEYSVAALCDEYPFDGQTVYAGELHYKEDGMWDTGRALTLGFELRNQSRLFILESDMDFATDSLINDINETVSSDIRIYRNLTVNRERLWNFLRSADKVLDISILSGQGEERPFDELEGASKADIVGKYPIEGATVAYQYQDQQIVVRYRNGSVTVQCDWNEATEYIIQIFERDVLNHRDIG